MKHLLFIIGDELLIHPNYKNYILQSYKAKFKELNDIKTLSKNDKNLPFLLENLIKEYDYITIFVDDENYATLAKIIATLNADSLSLNEGILMPSKLLHSAKNSFLNRVQNCKINVLKSDVNEELPELLGELNFDYTYFYLINIDKDSATLLLETLTKSHEVWIQASEILSTLVLFKAYASQYGELEAFMSAVNKLFSQKIILEEPIEFIASKLIQKNLKISFAESCTAGLCASNLASMSGISQIFEGSLVTYSKRLKNEWLGVDKSVLENGGVYSEKCVYFMLKGIFKTTKTDFALAISGVASGVDEGTKAGKIYIGAMYKDGSFLQESLELKGNRNFIREQASLASFKLLLDLKPEIFFT